ncbi:uncharacterized protein N7498_000354 [Penicillium cinerascens]|uniref:BTB domain-containing protein n=1 Tax=Penicillium cinerascens TaxID=70096 RepID=A0A9W9TE52_9EURO|nr:uncharacterized protein N7498_000354 [Penicillium cinerascens]KAJ5218255.1 hypothetical protein N7498_000354 [Penicillium cinerascens]
MDPPDYNRCVLTCPAQTRQKLADAREGLSEHSIIHSPSFTFLVGPKHTKLTIQSALAQHVSKPLHNLMNNGHTRESKHRIAVLEDEDVETFVAFCEYAYTGDYTVPLLPAPCEDIRKGVVEAALSPANSWRETYRSNSVSSAVPPPAPSPPESVRSAEPAAPAPTEPEPEPTPVIEGDGAGEEVKQAATTEHELLAEEDTTKNEPAEPLEDEETYPLNPGQNADVPAADEAPIQTNPEPAADDGDSGTWEETPAMSKRSKKKTLEQEPTWTEEAAANLTPPSTPPPKYPAEVVDTPQSPEPESPPEGESQREEKVVEAEPTAEPEEEDAKPAEEQPADTEVEPAQEDWEQPSAYPTDGDVQTHGDSWPEDEVEEQHDESQPPKPVIDMSFAKQPDSSPRTPGLSLWDEFSALQYNNEQTSLPTVEVSSSNDLPYLTFHAKVYVFATRYLIPALAQLCLQKLHRNLLQLSIADTESLDPFSGQNSGGLAAHQAPMVLDLLRYAYTKTTRLEPINPTSATQLRENELRRLVVHYAACKVKDLARYHSPGDSEAATPTLRPVDSKVERAKDSAPKSLRALLDMTPELASDLVYRMM